VDSSWGLRDGMEVEGQRHIQKIQEISYRISCVKINLRNESRHLNHETVLTRLYVVHCEALRDFTMSRIES
jgi:hypothetical protein